MKMQDYQTAFSPLHKVVIKAQLACTDSHGDSTLMSEDYSSKEKKIKPVNAPHSAVTQIIYCLFKITLPGHKIK